MIPSRIKNPTPQQRDLANVLMSIATSPFGAPDYLPKQFIPNHEDGTNFDERDFHVAAELATGKVFGACIMYLPQTGAFYFQPIDATFPVVSISNKRA